MVAAAREATGRGLEYLTAAVAADGAWPSMKYGERRLAGPCERETVPFVAALGALSLAACRDPRAAVLCERARAGLKARMEAPGVWRYWAGLPPDLDDTSICSLVVPPHVWTLLGRTEAAVLSRRDGEGRFLTWFAAQPTAESSWDDVDSVVNANVVAWLGDGEHTRAAQEWLETLIREGREDGTSWYYADTIELYAALARARELRAPAFRAIGPLLVERIASRRRGDGGYGDAQTTAQAVTALHRLGQAPEREAVEYLLGAQAPNGGWASGVVWQGPTPPTPPHVFFASSALCTARCIEAIVRYLDAGG